MMVTNSLRCVAPAGRGGSVRVDVRDDAREKTTAGLKPYPTGY